MAAGFFTALGAGVAKEIYDGIIRGFGYADFEMDVLATAMGGLAMSLTLPAIQLMYSQFRRSTTKGGDLGAGMPPRHEV